MATHSLNLFGVLSETKRIINAHSSHFLALSVIFLLPLSFSPIVYPSFVRSPSSLSHYHQTLFFFSSPDDDIPPIAKSDLVLAALYWFFVLLLSLCATSSITYSTFHGFYGRPVKFISSIKSILFALLPLISTLIISQARPTGKSAGEIEGAHDELLDETDFAVVAEEKEIHLKLNLPRIVEVSDAKYVTTCLIQQLLAHSCI